MSVVVLYVDIRIDPPKLQKSVLDWSERMEASEAVQKALGNQVLQRLQLDLTNNNKDLIISWSNKETGEHSDIGGVDSLDWAIPDQSILAIVYEDEIADEAVVNLSNDWMQANYD